MFEAPHPSPGHAPPRRAERAFVALTLAALVVVPQLVWEAFPLTANPMFARSLRERREYRLTDATGAVLNNDLYGLRTNVNWYLEDTYAVKYPGTVVPPTDQPPDTEQVLRHVRRVGRREGAAFPLTLSCRVVGAVDGDRVGVVSDAAWVIGPDGDG